MPAATVGCVHTDPGRIRSGPGGRPAESPACMVSPVGFRWELRVHRLAGPTPVSPAGSGLVCKRSLRTGYPRYWRWRCWRAPAGTECPIVQMGKPRAWLGRGSPRVCGAQRMTLAGVGSGFLVGRQLRLKAYRGLSPHVTSGGSRLAQQPGGLYRWAEGWGKMAAWVGRAESG